ncbi:MULTISPECIES: OmpP1/FadL family transporter [unclassified Helicobacter]|uniref:OmpP1/FadL family transporter n=1 Tax=unclassified Helicobacter TaxID=2593540 RepID=UPI000CF0DD85|nr:MULTISPECIES: outer membrane protein transport protein [unclassified Helicobacter]
MKSYISILFFSLFPLSICYSGGFKVQEQSLNGTALNSAYVAGSRGADASYYNPANMGFSNDWNENKSEFEFATSLIQIPGFNFQVPTTNQGLRSHTTIAYDSFLQSVANLLPSVIPADIDILHSQADSQIINGSTGTTNFILPKFFYKTRTKNGFTFGASFVASSGLAMQWKDKGGEFLQDVFIMMVELSPSISYTFNDRISFGFGPRIMYAMGSFNNVVYVPMKWKDGQNLGGPTCIDPNNSCITLTGADLDAIGIDNIPNELMSQSQKDMLKQLITPGTFLHTITLGKYNSIADIVKTSTTTMYGTTKVYQKSEGKDLSAGYRLSASLRVFDNGMFSVVYNSSVPFHMKGSLEATSYVGGAMGNVLTQTSLDIAVNMPEILTLAYAHEFFDKKLRIEGVYERTFWAKGPNFSVTPDFDNAIYTGLSGMVTHFSSDKLKSMVGLADFSQVSNMGAGWRDTNTFRLGITYSNHKNLRLMGSIAYDEAPSPQNKIGIPDSNGYMFSLGGKYKFRDFILGVAYSLTLKDNRESLYQQLLNLGQLRILTASLEYHW